ncbi:MAG: creatininase family protein [Clostridia bacterium]|nr:creatininase family protein [Clostridia bacterium]
MQLVEMFYDQIQDAVDRKVPFIIPIGTLEYHAHHASCGTDTLVITGCLRKLEEEKELVVCPPIWYGVASYAVCEPKPGHFHIDEDAYAAYIYCVVKSMLAAGHKNVYLIPHHQTENDGLMPMTIACHKAAKKATMEYMEEKFGKGWWGSDDYANYYDSLGEADDPFSYVKVLPLIGKEAQKKCGGFDHAGKWETSLMLGVEPEKVDLTRCKDNTEWFAASAKEASTELGAHMVECTLEWLREVIR